MRYIFLVLIIILSAWAPMFAATLTVYPNGNVTVAVAASQYINVFTTGSGYAQIRQQVGGPSTNQVARFADITGSPLTNGEYSFGPFTTATNVRIDAYVDAALYSVSTLGVAIPCVKPGSAIGRTQFSPVTINTTGTALASDLLTGIITSTQSTGATITITLPTGTLLDAGAGLQINQAFDFQLINLSTSAANTVTIAAGSGNTLVGDAITQASGLTTGCSSSRWRARKTAANTFVTYRVN